MLVWPHSQAHTREPWNEAYVKYTFKIASLGQYSMQSFNSFPQLSIVCEKHKKTNLLALFSMMAFSVHTIRTGLHSLLVEDALLLQAL